MARKKFWVDKRFLNKLLKREKIKDVSALRSKKNREARDRIVRDLVQYLHAKGLSDKDIKKEIRKRNISIPKKALGGHKKLMLFAGIFEYVENRVDYIKRLKLDTKPKEEKIFRHKNFAKGEFAYKVRLEGYDKGGNRKARYGLIAFDRIKSKREVMRAVGLLFRGELDLAIETGLIFESPSLEILFEDFVFDKIDVVGLFTGQ